MNDFYDLYNQTRLIMDEGMASAKSNYLATGKIDKNDFDKLAKADPTKTKKYIDWMCKQTIEGNDVDQIIVLIKDFDRLVNKNLIKDKDIYSYDYESATDEVEKYRKKKTKTETEKLVKEDVETVLDNDKVLVVAPKTKEAAILYGKGTKWCTSALKNNAFDEYYFGSHVNLYYIVDKRTNEKHAVAVNLDGSKEVWGEDGDMLSSSETRMLFKELGLE